MHTTVHTCSNMNSRARYCACTVRMMPSRCQSPPEGPTTGGHTLHQMGAAHENGPAGKY